MDLPANPVIRRSPSNGWSIVAFVVVALAIVFASRAMIQTPNVEIGDFAANGLLIQDAKSLTLLKGNYSRIGANHPGPAILYVLAFGEWLFHDVLGFVKAPFSGQLIAVAMYSAFWIVLLGRSFRWITRPAPAVLCTAVFLLAASICDHRFFDGAWFPDLYFFPFAVMLVSIARLANGTCEGLVSLALSAGFLVNGHVSFIPMLVIILIAVVTLNWLRFSHGPDDRRILGRTFFITHRRRLRLASGIFALFFVPLVLETIVAFPGPIKTYVTFGGSQTTHETAEAIDFIASYWGGLLPGLAALALMWLLGRLASNAPAARDALVSGVFAMIAATIAAVVYAKYGVDLLEFKYVALFYYAVPSFAIALTVAAVFEATHKPVTNTVVMLITALCVWGIYDNARVAPLYADQYNAPAILALDTLLQSKSSAGRVVLDLDNMNDWGYLWTHLVGVEVLAKRRRQQTFCVAKNWHLLFTASARCTIDELHSDRRYIVRVMNASSVEPERLQFQAARLGFYRYEAPDITDRGYIAVSAGGKPFDEYFLEEGWSPSNEDFAWTTSKQSHLSLRVRPGFTGSIELDLDAFLPTPTSRQDVIMSVDGVRIGEYTWDASHRRRKIELPVAGSPSGLIDVALDIRRPLVPARFGGANTDTRTLAISLYGLEVKPR